MAEVTNEDLQKQIDELKADHSNKIADLTEKVNTLQGVKPAAVKKPDVFKPEAAENLDDSGNPANEYHFSALKDGKTVKFKFLFGHVTPPVVPGQPPKAKVTAKVAQADKALQAALVKEDSGQIKQVF